MKKWAEVAWWRHVLNHRRCHWVAWRCTDGWMCIGCHKTWDVNGRVDTSEDAW